MTSGGTAYSSGYFYPMELRPAGTYTLAQFNPPSVTFSNNFYIGRYEVTNAQYRQFDATSAHHDNITELNNITYDNYPVRYVSWTDAAQFCNWLTTQELGAGECCYTWTTASDHSTYTLDLLKKGYRLPTEAEWEYACRAGTTTDYYWGENFGNPVGSPFNIGNYAWYSGNYTGDIHPVGQKLPNAWGLYDMSGNLWEWCYNRLESPPAGGSDPVGPGVDASRVVRGGSFNYGNNGCLSSSRNYFVPSFRNNGIGFRLVRTQKSFALLPFYTFRNLTTKVSKAGRNIPK
jgi:formylglycine-generating enzyme required for sulfatase activity